MRGQALKDLYRSLGPRGFTHRLVSLMEGDKPKLRPDEFSIRELFEACVGPVAEMFPSAGGFLAPIQEEALGTTIFPNVMGVLISKKVIDGYNAPGYIGDQLVTNMPSRLRSERLVGFTAVEQPGEVPEGMPYPETGFTEKFVTTEAAKKGYMISVTEEAVTFDQTGQLLLKAQRIGEKIRLERETVILNGVQDTASVVFKPQGAAEALYRASGGTNSTTVNKRTHSGFGLVDWTDVDEATQLFAAMVDEAGDVIVVLPRVLLIPPALRMVGNRICHATELRDATASAANVAVYSNPNADLIPLSSPLLSSSTTWYLGDPANQFVWQEVWPVQVLRASEADPDNFNRDIVAKFKARYFGGIGALDDKYVVQTTLT